MSDTLLRLGIVAVAALVAWLIVLAGRRVVERGRHGALAAAPLASVAGAEALLEAQPATPVRILAFSSADCSQCHRLQAPALQRVLAARTERVSVVEIDAPSAPALTRHYNVLTVPTTVVIDSTGRAHAVNYGFANSRTLLDQVDRLLHEQPQPAGAGKR
jgi:thiol:disulfide interchange protein